MFDGADTQETKSKLQHLTDDNTANSEASDRSVHLKSIPVLHLTHSSVHLREILVSIVFISSTF